MIFEKTEHGNYLCWGYSESIADDEIKGLLLKHNCPDEGEHYRFHSNRSVMTTMDIKQIGIRMAELNGLLRVEGKR